MASIDSNFASFTYTPRSLPEDDTSMVSSAHPTMETEGVQAEI